jgi:hypothetical protein
MSGRNVQRKLGTTRGSPRRSRTAKASRISRIVGEIVMCPRVGRMGLISVDGPGQKNLDWSESPWGGVEPHSKAVHRGVVGPAQNGTTESDYEVHEGQRQTMSPSANAGSRLKRWCVGKALSDMPAFQPYWGKPAVRNDRGDGGNVGIIRSPLRATVLPDCGGRSAMVVPTATVIRLLPVCP